jgi:hypothetical protein
MNDELQKWLTEATADQPIFRSDFVLDEDPEAKPWWRRQIAEELAKVYSVMIVGEDDLMTLTAIGSEMALTYFFEHYFTLVPQMRQQMMDAVEAAETKAAEEGKTLKPRGLNNVMGKAMKALLATEAAKLNDIRVSVMEENPDTASVCNELYTRVENAVSDGLADIPELD